MPPHFLRGCSALVIRCFKGVERFADWITGAAGPVFVVLCWVLIVGGGFAFFDVVARDMSYTSFLFASPLYILTPLNLYGQYYLVCSVPPGFPAPKASGMTKREAQWLIPHPRSLWSVERWGWKRKGKPLSGGFHTAAPRRVRRCRKCDGPKPERTHHCSVCKRCVLLMDHHCPWINACVGLHNQRHFVLFMGWLSLACWIVSVMGYAKFWESLESRNWPSYTPMILFTLIWVLAVAIGVAVPILGSWHLWMVAHGETSIEAHDNDYLTGRAKAEGLIYLNPFDLGKRRNLQIFFSLGKDGYPWTTLLLPLVVPPMSNGWAYPRRSLPSAPARKDVDLHSPELAAGLIGGNTAENGMGGGGRYVMDDGGHDLTDDEEGGGGWMDALPPSPRD